MYKIGVVGPNRSVERILELANEFEQGMAFIPYPYVETKEIEGIVLENDHKVDSWLFSGSIPYRIARGALGSDEKLVHIRLTESSLYKCFLDLAFSQGKLIDRVSIDIFTISDIDIDRALQELEMAPHDLHVKYFDTDIEPEELFLFHLDLWKSGKTEGAFTCFSMVFEALKEAGVPTFLISPSRMEILQTLRIFIEKVNTSYFKETQIGIEIIEIEQFDTIIEKAKSPYHLQYLELRLKKSLIDLCEKLDGSLLEKGNGRYVIFSSRGAIEREIRMLQSTIEYLSLEADTTVAVGIGFGETAFSAETNAHRAIRLSKGKEEHGIVIIKEDGTMIESVGQEEELTFSYRTDDKDFMEKLKKGNISVKSYKKIEALNRRMGWSVFTSRDLAAHLHMSERNAQRIVSELCEAELAEYIGEEYAHTRGRPNKMYRLK
ncbi:hypothetical protein [Paenibacillus agricola]|uniref:Transcriptional regulator n=1 Tax=Paenibacillus agricola TaxID=2716264 RepID=A0ABX0J5X3_9BACL|nr:hypothetical protein [Paenibacillus agricola]NHN31724.1 hypothetical protein [Paenibacillus agricola]